jgi:hypothetical protein
VGRTARSLVVGGVLAAASAAGATACSLFTDLNGFGGGHTDNRADTDAAVDATADAAAVDAGAGATIGDAGADRLPDDPYAAAVLADAPVAFLRLDEPSGTTVHDVRGEAVGELQGGCGLARPGRVGTALELDGASCRLSLGARFPFAGRSPFTIEVWVRPTIADGQIRRVVHRSSRSLASTSGYTMYFRDVFVQTTRTGVSTDDGYATGEPLPTTAFTHLAMTYDGTTVRLYTNGVLDGSQPSASEIVDPADPELVFGDRAEQVYFKFAGLLDEIAIYDKALAASRIEAHVDAAP